MKRLMALFFVVLVAATLFAETLRCPYDNVPAYNTYQMVWKGMHNFYIYKCGFCGSFFYVRVN